MTFPSLQAQVLHPSYQVVQFLGQVSFAGFSLNFLHWALPFLAQARLVQLVTFPSLQAQVLQPSYQVLHSGGHDWLVVGRADDVSGMQIRKPRATKNLKVSPPYLACYYAMIGHLQLQGVLDADAT